MKQIIWLLLILFTTGCGSQSHQPIPYTPSTKVQRAIDIAMGVTLPNDSDFTELDVAPIINGVSSPDGVINLGDAIVLMQLERP